MTHSAHSQRELGWAGYAEQYIIGFVDGESTRTDVNWEFVQHPDYWTTEEPEVEPQWIVATDIFIANDFSTMYEYQKIALVMHEMGHGLGLRHQTAAGNIMSYSMWASIKEALRPIVMLSNYLDDTLPIYNFDEFTERLLQYNIDDDARFGQMVSNLIQPQAQDKTAFQCVHDFARWGSGR